MQVNVHKYGPEGGVDLNRAMSTAYNETRAFLMHNYDITEDVVSILLNESHSLCLAAPISMSSMMFMSLSSQQFSCCWMHNMFG